MPIISLGYNEKNRWKGIGWYKVYCNEMKCNVIANVIKTVKDADN